METITDYIASLSVNDILIYAKPFIIALFMLIIGWWIIKKFSSWISSVTDTKLPDKTLAKFFSSATEIILKVLLVISIASYIGIETTSFLAVLGAAGLAVGLALQGSLSNFAGGVMILIFRPIQIGEYIEAQGFEGIVTDIGIFVTQLKTFDEKIIILPNGPLANGNIVNHTRSDIRAVEINIGISYSDNIALAKKSMESVLYNDTRILRNKNNIVEVIDLGESSVDFIVRAFTKTENYWELFFSLRPLLKQAVEEVGATIPFPQRDVHLLKHSQETSI